MKHFKYLFLIILWSCSSNNTNEIDRLVEKYSAASSNVLTAESGTIEVSPVIQRNSDSVPYAISLNGATKNTKALAEVLSVLINDKKQKGYQPLQDYKIDFSPKYIELMFDYLDCGFKKDSLYFEVFVIYRKGSNYIYDFSLTNKDNSRLTGNKTHIDF